MALQHSQTTYNIKLKKISNPYFMHHCEVKNIYLGSTIFFQFFRNDDPSSIEPTNRPLSYGTHDPFNRVLGFILLKKRHIKLANPSPTVQIAARGSCRDR